VRAHRADVTGEVVTPFDVSIDLNGRTGSKGVELVGASMHEKLEVSV
jgi:hypothetical protein